MTEEIQTLFDEWFYSQEGYHTLAERFYGELDYGSRVRREMTAKGWLMAAFNEGFERGYKEGY